MPRLRVGHEHEHLDLREVGQLDGAGLADQERVRALAGAPRQRAHRVHRLAEPGHAQRAHHDAWCIAHAASARCSQGRQCMHSPARLHACRGALSLRAAGNVPQAMREAPCKADTHTTPVRNSPGRAGARRRAPTMLAARAFSTRKRRRRSARASSGGRPSRRPWPRASSVAQRAPAAASCSCASAGAASSPTHAHAHSFTCPHRHPARPRRGM